MTWDVIVDFFGAEPGARDVPAGAFAAGLRYLQPTDFPLTEVSLVDCVDFVWMKRAD